MTDAWETTHGLNPNNPDDAFTDLDGDRVPNLWEYARGTDPTDPQSKPAWDAVVDGSLTASDPQQGLYKTLQEAYDALSDGAYRSLVRIKPGYYHGGWTGAGDPKKAAWLGDLGPEKATVAADSIDPVVVLTDETVLDGIEITAGDDLMHYGFNGTLVVAQPDASLSLPPEIRLVNCILRDSYSWAGPGALENDGCILVLEHCTLWNNEGNTAQSIENIDGTVAIQYSIVYSPWSVYPEIQDTAQGVTVHQSIVHGGFGGGIDSDPHLTFLGYLTAYSTAAINSGSGSTLQHDLHGQTRPIASIADLGADEWLDTDEDELPDWWEQHYFGHFSYHEANNPDGDIWQNWDEYFFGLNPMLPFEDVDRDGLDDAWEIEHFGHLLWGANDNPDGDSLPNWLEYQLGTNPDAFDVDGDGDGLLDADEMFWFGHLDQSYHSDFDGDSVPDGIEIYVTETDPTDPQTFAVPDLWLYIAWQLGYNLTSGDIDGDGLDWAEEAAIGTSPFLYDTDGDGLHDGIDPFPLHPSNPSVTSVSGPPVLTLHSPPGASPVP